jgi:hypothetical protein
MTPDATRLPAHHPDAPYRGPAARLRQAIHAAGLASTEVTGATPEDFDGARYLMHVVALGPLVILRPGAWPHWPTPSARAQAIRLPWEDACATVEGFAQGRASRLKRQGDDPGEIALGQDTEALWRALQETARVLGEIGRLAAEVVS